MNVVLVPTETAGGAPVTVTVTIPDGSGSSVTFLIEVSGTEPLLKSSVLVNVNVVENEPPTIVSIDGQPTKTKFVVSPNLQTARFSVVAEDDFQPENMIWEISDAVGAEVNFVVNEELRTTATTARGSNPSVSFVRTPPTTEAGLAFTLAVTEAGRAGLVDTVRVTVMVGTTSTAGSPVPGTRWRSLYRVVTNYPIYILTPNATDPGLGETAALDWTVTADDVVITGADDGVFTAKGSEVTIASAVASPRTTLSGEYIIEIRNSYGKVYSHRIMHSRANEPPSVTYWVGNDFGAGKTRGPRDGRPIDLPLGEATTVTFSADDPVGEPVKGSTFMWTLEEQMGLTATFVGVTTSTSGVSTATTTTGSVSTGTIVVVQFEEEIPELGGYFYITVSDGRGNVNGGAGDRSIRVNLPRAAAAGGELRIRMFLGGAVR